VPEVRRRTAALRVEIAHAHALQQQARGARLALQGEIRTLDARRRQLAGLETAQRLAARDANGSADREAERALALAEKARDLGGLVDGLEQAALLREKLARLPGPVLRPARAGDPAAEPEAPQASARLAGFTLPVAGRLVPALAMPRAAARRMGSGCRCAGARRWWRPPRAAWPLPMPMPVWADRHHRPSRRLDQPVTGLGTLAVRVGDMLVAGSPIGTAGAETRAAAGVDAGTAQGWAAGEPAGSDRG
jgi:septal ring factor EnvC (AmiA/AmiB activator)